MRETENTTTRTPAGNERFGASGAVTPQTILWELARYYPAASVVEAPPAPNCRHVGCKASRALSTKHKARPAKPSEQEKVYKK